ncbi:MAG: hypothetical protein IT579_13590 [Verrucomicrobia subdivision 3 bacterium]|nr:hypothetical protein [Limisphaerales bacterium]
MNVTLTQLAAGLTCTKKSISKALEGTSPCTQITVFGQKTNAWSLGSLPESLRCRLTAATRQRGYRTIEDLLRTPPLPYTPPFPFNEVATEHQVKAEQWREALALPLVRQHSTPPGELLALGLSEALRVFKYPVAENTWRAHFDQAIKRDNNFEQWHRLDLYVADAAYQTVNQSGAPGGLPVGIHAALSARVDELKIDHLRPSLEDRAHLLDATFRHFEAFELAIKDRRQQLLIKRSLNAFLFSTMPTIAATPAALRRMFERKFDKWRKDGRCPDAIMDQRCGNSGRTGGKLCDGCLEKLISNSVHRDGPIPPAHRKLYQLRGTPAGYCEPCSEMVHLNERKNKSYVSRGITLQVAAAVLKLVDQRRGDGAIYQNSPWISRAWSDVAPGDFLSSDDVTWNFPFRYEDGTGRIGRGECILTVDWRTDFIVDAMLIAGHFNQEHIRLSIEHACVKINGRPRFGFFFENSVYKSLAVDGRDSAKHPKWALTPWRDTEAAFRKLGLEVGSRSNMDFGLADPALGLEVRHTKPRNPRSKPIEGAIRRLQEIQRPIDNFLGFDEREYNAEAAQKNLRQARQFDAAALSKIPVMGQWRDMVDQTIREYNEEIQNGKKLPGVSPLEAWTNGIDGNAGIATRPLPGLDLETRFRLGTWQRKIRVGSEGIVISIGNRKYPYWGKELEPFIHKDVIARFHFADPSILFCRSMDSQHFFVLKHATAKSTFERPEVLAELNRERAAMMTPARVEFSKLVPPVTFSITRDATTDQQTQVFARFSQEQLEKHHAEKRAATATANQIKTLSSALSVPVNVNPARAAQQLEALKRMEQRRAKLNDQFASEETTK